MVKPILSITLSNIDLVGKQRARVTKNGTYTPKRTVVFEESIRNAAETVMQELNLDQFDGVELGVLIGVRFGSGRRADMDNVAKSVLDGLQQKTYRKQGYTSPGMYKSDNRVRSVIAVELAHHVEHPSITITVYTHENLTTLLKGILPDAAI